MRIMRMVSALVLVISLLTGCTNSPSSSKNDDRLVANQVLELESGTVHYSYMLPEDYDESKTYPLVITMPGYDRMWFGEDSQGANLDWDGFTCWTNLNEDMIVVSAQLTDWQETSALQAIELTEYFIEHFPVNTHRIYANGYSAGGETMSRAVSMRPDLYAAYLHGASQWDGTYEPVAQNQVAVYIYMAQSDEYYGSQRATEAYDQLVQAYQNQGMDAQTIDSLVQIQIPDDAYFAQFGMTDNYHGAANVVYQDETILDWIISHEK